MLPNWPALPGRQDRQNQGEERPCAGGAAPAIGEAAHAAEVAQPTGEAVGGAIPTPSGKLFPGGLQTLRNSWPKAQIKTRSLKPYKKLSLAGDFVAEALVDTIRSASRSMLATVMARRALWLKPWSADLASKSNWCRIPYDGVNLFGAKLDTAISKVTGGKSGLIPSDRRPKQQRAPSFKRNLPERYRDAKSYRPGKEYRRTWKNPQTSFLKFQKTKTPASNEQKPF